MLSREGRHYMEQAPWLALWPGLCLTMVVYSLNMFGDAGETCSRGSEVPWGVSTRTAPGRFKFGGGVPRVGDAVRPARSGLRGGGGGASLGSGGMSARAIEGARRALQKAERSG